MIKEIKEKLSETNDFIANHFWPLLIIFTPIFGVYEILKIVIYRFLWDNIFVSYTVVIFIINFIFNGLLVLMVIFVIDQIYHKKKFSFSDIKSFIIKYFVMVSFSVFIIGILVQIGFLLLIVPGIYIMARLAIVPYLQSLDGIKLKESFQLSYELSKNNAWVIFICTSIIFIPILIFLLIQRGVSNQLVYSLLSILLHLIYIAEVVLIYHFYIDIKENMRAFFSSKNNSE
ncbi:MAG: hypothetical protein P8Y99_12815 [Calditrichaceae bacterium]